MESAEKIQGAELHSDDTMIDPSDIEKCISSAPIVTLTDSKSEIQKNTGSKNVGIMIQIQDEFTIIDNISEKLAYEYLRKFPLNFYTLSFKDKALDKQYRQDRQYIINNMNLTTCVLMGILCFMFLIAEVYTVFSASQEFNFSVAIIDAYVTWIPQTVASILMISYYAIGKSKYIPSTFKKIFLNTMVIIVLPFIIVDITCGAVI